MNGTAYIVCDSHPGLSFIGDQKTCLALRRYAGFTILEHHILYAIEAGCRDITFIAGRDIDIIEESVAQLDLSGIFLNFICCPFVVSGRSHESPLITNAACPPSGLVLYLSQLSFLGDSAYSGFPPMDIHERVFGWIFRCKVFRQRSVRVAPDVLIEDGVTVGNHVKLIGPAYICQGTVIRDGAEIGPYALIESGCILDSQSIVRNACVRKGTYIGKGILLDSCWVNGGMIYDFRSMDSTSIQDDLVIGEVFSHGESECLAGIFGRLFAVICLLVFMPWSFLLLIGHVVQLRKWPEFVKNRYVRRQPGGRAENLMEYELIELACGPGVSKFYFNLLNVASGRMRWFGNPPISRENVTLLQTEFAGMWLDCPPGVLSLGGSLGVSAQDIDAMSAHSSYFSAFQSLELKLKILRQYISGKRRRNTSLQDKYTRSVSIPY